MEERGIGRSESTEVLAVVSFGNVRRGDRLQVDASAPHVAGLIKAGYFKVICEEPDATVDDSERAGNVSDSGVDVGVVRPAKAAKRKVSDGEDSRQPDSENRHSAPSGRAAHPQDVESDHRGGAQAGA